MSYGERCDRAVLYVKCFYAVAGAAFLGLVEILDRAKLGKKLMLYFTLYLTWDSYAWAKTYANAHPEKSGLEIAAIIAAVLTAVSVLQGAVVKYYLQESTDSKRIDAAG